MDQRLSLITLGVADLVRSSVFYKALGWKVGFESDSIVCFQLNGFIFSLYPRAELDKDMTRSNSGTGSFALAFMYGRSPRLIRCSKKRSRPVLPC